MANRKEKLRSLRDNPVRVESQLGFNTDNTAITLTQGTDNEGL